MIGRVLLVLTVVGCVLNSATALAPPDWLKKGLEKFEEFQKSGKDLGEKLEKLRESGKDLGEECVGWDTVNEVKANLTSEYNKLPKTQEELEALAKAEVAKGISQEKAKADVEAYVNQTFSKFEELKNVKGCKVKAELVCKDGKCVKCEDAGNDYVKVCEGLKAANAKNAGEVAGKIKKSEGGKVTVGGSGMLFGLVCSFLY